MFETVRMTYRWIYFMVWMYRNCNQMKESVELSIELRTKLEGLGILGIKLGQYLCNRPDISSDTMKKELSVFLTSNTVHDISHTQQIIDQAGYSHIQLGEVIGSGSLAQVYKCTLPNEEEPLVIKINHPQVSELAGEISILKNIIKCMGWIPRCNFIFHMDWDDFFTKISDQIDMRHEASNLKRYYDIYHGNMEEITIPRYIDGSSDFIIMTYCEGRPLHLFEKIDPVYQKAHNLFTASYIHTGMCHNVMHGDVHTGNILVKDDGLISIIDFGLCLEISMEQYLGILAISKFESNPTLENCEDFVQALIHPTDLEDRPIDINVLTQEFYHDFMNEYKNTVEHTIAGVLDLMISSLRKYNVILQGTILSYFLNIILLEGLSPFSEKQQMSSLIAASYIKKHPFLKTQSAERITDYYKTMYAKTLPELINKYNILHPDQL